MKKIVLLCIAIALYNTLYSCDVCGSSYSSGGIGIQPMSAKHFVGMRYQYFSSNSISHDGKSSSHELLQSFALWNRFTIAKKLQVFTALPFKYNIRNTTKTKESVYGMGDASIMASYIILNTTNNNRKLRHTLRGGLGIKLPTGKYDQLHEGILLHPNMQAGTGSLDMHTNMNYTISYKMVGINAELNYNRNGTNKIYFHFGNKYVSNLNFFIRKEVKQYIFLPQVGLQFDYALQDVQSSILQTHSGGKIIKVNTCIDFYYKNIAFMIQLQIAAKQNLGEGYIHSYPQLNSNFIFLF